MNYGLQVSIASNVLTVALKGNDGEDPSFNLPVILAFRDTSETSGKQIWVKHPEPLAISAPAGARLGTVAGIPFRLWIVGVYDGSAMALGLWQSVSGGALPTAVAPLDETKLISTVAISSGSLLSKTFYTVAAVASCAFRILGYLDFPGLAAAGVYNVAPVKVQLFDAGVKKPGDILQTIFSASAQASTSSAIYVDSLLLGNITMSAKPNLARVTVAGRLQTSSKNQVVNASLFRRMVGFADVALRGVAAIFVTSEASTAMDVDPTVDPTGSVGVTASQRSTDAVPIPGLIDVSVTFGAIASPSVSADTTTTASVGSGINLDTIDAPGSDGIVTYVEKFASSSGLAYTGADTMTIQEIMV